MIWARVKWLEGQRVIDDTIPAKWVDVEKKLVYWPRKDKNKALATDASPQQSWLKFPLLKKKIEDEEEQVCVNYDFTTEDDDDEVCPTKNVQTTETPKRAAPMPPPSPAKTSSPQSFLADFRNRWGKKKNNCKISQNQENIERIDTPSSSANTNINVDDICEESPQVCSGRETPNSSANANMSVNINEESPQVCSGRGSLKRKQAGNFNVDKQDDTSFKIVASEETADLRTLFKMMKKSTRVLMEIKNILTEQVNQSICDGQFVHAESIDQLKELDEELRDLEKRKELISYLQGIGGSDFADHTKSAMKRIMTNGVMAKMNMQGNGPKTDGQKKIAFVQMRTYQVIIDSVKARHKKISESEIKKVIQNYLRNAPGRQDGGKRKVPKNRVEDDNDSFDTE